jgi:hypothetical protein
MSYALNGRGNVGLNSVFTVYLGGRLELNNFFCLVPGM